MTNGSKSMLQSVITSVVVATLLSGGAVLISVKVMGSELDRAQADLATQTATVTSNREALVALRAAKNVSDERDAQRWEDVKEELSKIRVTQTEILKALPSRWREPEGRRR